MTCCEGWTSCNGFSLLILIILGVVINCIPLGISLVEGESASQNPISCYEWWLPGIIGAGALVSNTCLAWLDLETGVLLFTRVFKCDFQPCSQLCLHRIWVGM